VLLPADVGPTMATATPRLSSTSWDSLMALCTGSHPSPPSESARAASQSQARARTSADRRATPAPSGSRQERPWSSSMNSSSAGSLASPCCCTTCCAMGCTRPMMCLSRARRLFWRPSAARARTSMM